MLRHPPNLTILLSWFFPKLDRISIEFLRQSSAYADSRNSLDFFEVLNSSRQHNRCFILIFRFVFLEDSSNFFSQTLECFYTSSKWSRIHIIIGSKNGVTGMLSWINNYPIKDIN